MTAGVSIRSINKSFGALYVLKDISLEVEPGEFTVLLGPSGCGKSTLLGAVAGLEEVGSGSVHIGGNDVTGQEPSKRGIAMVFQSYALYPTMTVRQNLSFGLRVGRTPAAEVKRRVDWAADLLQIRDLLDRKPGQLSGGQRQRVAIGRALVRKARVFLFDEPLSNLDAKLRTEMRIEIKRLHQELGATILYVTHDQIEAMTLATRIAVMRAGKVEQYATPSELYRRPETLFVAGFVGSPAMNFLTGRIVREDGLLVEVEGQRFPLDGYAFRQPVQDGQDIVLGIRPEHISIGESGHNGVASADAVLRFIEPMGADTLGWFDIGTQRVSARLEPQIASDLSGPARLVLDLAHASVFSPETSARL